MLVKYYVRTTVRGYQPVQFNLINVIKTDIYNPLSLASEAARAGDFTKCAAYVENIAEIFFPLDGGDDPVWPNAANNAFKRAAYGLIDYYLEEEKELRKRAETTGMDETVLETKIDTMWGKVTLYNCYQLFVQLSSKKMKNPMSEFQAKVKKANECMKNDVPSSDPEIQAIIEMSQEEYEEKRKDMERQSLLWENKAEIDLMTLFFNATAMMPKNSMRTLVNNAHNALVSMSSAEKMLASVYGIAVTAMVRYVYG